jgi:hypothetical protein
VDSSPSNSIGLLQTAAKISPECLPAGQPVSDEDDWGEKVALGHALAGLCECRNVLRLSDTSAMTFEAHFRRIGLPPLNQAIGLLVINGAIKLSLGDGGTIMLIVGNITRDSNKKMPLNLWMHFAVVVDRGNISLYVDGSPAISGVETNTNLVTPPICLKVGSNISHVTEVRVWSSVRTVPQIRDFMYSPLPLGAGSSKWKGFKIKSSATNTPPEPLQPIQIPFPSLERRHRVRPLTSATPSAVSETPVPTEPVVPETREDPLVPTDLPPPRDIPEQNSITAPDQPAPIVPDSPVVHSQSPRPPSEMVLSSTATLGEVLDFIDRQLDTALALFRGSEKELETTRKTFLNIAATVSSYMQAKYRFGPFLAPLPSTEILSRLRLSCQYAAICTVLMRSEDNFTRIVHCLRIPMLDEDLEVFTRRAIHTAWDRGDSVAALSLLGMFVNSFPNRVDEIQKLRKTLGDVLGSPRRSATTQITCPSCDRKLRDPLQRACECRAIISVCYSSGRIVSREDCVLCTVCKSEYCLQHRNYPLSGSVPYARTQSLPGTCEFCFCKQSLFAG